MHNRYAIFDVICVISLCSIIKDTQNIFINRSLILKENATQKKNLVPLGKKKLGTCGRMPGDPNDQIDFTKERNTVGKYYCRELFIVPLLYFDLGKSNKMNSLSLIIVYFSHSRR